MTEIKLMTKEHEMWNETSSYAEGCSWKAGAFLADKMKKNDFSEVERVLVACIDGEIAGFSTLAEKDELSANYTFTPFIGFVYVDERFREKRLSEQMIHCAMQYARECGYESIYIMSGEEGLYEKYGFQKLGDYETIYGTTDQLFVRSTEC